MPYFAHRQIKKDSYLSLATEDKRSVAALTGYENCKKKGVILLFCCHPAANAENFKECRRKKHLQRLSLKHQ